MITCMGLMVGCVESAYQQDLLNQCARWLKNYKHLLNPGLEFIVEGMTFFTVIDSHIENGEVFILCKMYDGFTKMGTSE